MYKAISPFRIILKQRRNNSLRLYRATIIKKRESGELSIHELIVLQASEYRYLQYQETAVFICSVTAFVVTPLRQLPLLRCDDCRNPVATTVVTPLRF